MDQEMENQEPQWCCPGHHLWEKRGRIWKHWNWCPGAKVWMADKVAPMLLELGVREDGRIERVRKWNARLGNWNWEVVGGQVWENDIEVNRLWCSVESGQGEGDAFLSEGIIEKVGMTTVESHQNPPNGIKEGRLVHVWDPTMCRIIIYGGDERKMERMLEKEKEKGKGLEIMLHSFVFLVRNHFVCVNVDRPKRTYEYFDSMLKWEKREKGHLPDDTRQKVIDRIIAFLKLLDPDSKEEGKEYKAVDASHPRATQKCPQQSNNVDCGVMVLLSIQAFVLDRSFPKDRTMWQQRARDVRKQLCYNIVVDNNLRLTSIPPPSEFIHM